MKNYLVLSLLFIFLSDAVHADGQLDESVETQINAMASLEEVAQAVICAEDLNLCQLTFASWKRPWGYDLNGSATNGFFQNYDDYLDHWVTIKLSMGLKRTEYVESEKTRLKTALDKVTSRKRENQNN